MRVTTDDGTWPDRDCLLGSADPPTGRAHSRLPQIVPVFPTGPHRLFEIGVQFRPVRDLHLGGIPLDASAKSLSQDAEQIDLGQPRGILEIRSRVGNQSLDRIDPFLVGPAFHPAILGRGQRVAVTQGIIFLHVGQARIIGAVIQEGVGLAASPIRARFRRRRCHHHPRRRIRPGTNLQLKI